MVKDKQLEVKWLEGAEEAYHRVITNLNQKGKITLTDQVLVMIVKNLLESIKTIQILSILNREESIPILTRAFIELQVSLRFILKKNTENLARSYYYNNKITKMKNLIKMQKSNPRYELNNLTEQELETLRKSVPNATSIKDYINHYEKKWHKMFVPYKGKKGKQYRKWYALSWEYQSFKDMMKAVEIDESMYHFFYGMTSIDAHGMNATENITINNSNYKLTGTIPSYLCFAIIESYFSNSIYQISEYYSLVEDEGQVSAFTKMANYSVFL